MEDIISKYKKDCRLRGLANKTIIDYSFHIGKFKRFLDYQEPNVEIIKANKEILKSYLLTLQERGLSRRTIEINFAALHSFYDFLVESEIIDSNPVDRFRKRYLRSYKNDFGNRRQIISIEAAAKLVNSILDTRDRAIVLLLFKTGIRLHELAELDIDDINLEDQSLTLKPTPKRSNRTVFFDEEAQYALRRWLILRNKRVTKDNALFLSPNGQRLLRNSIYALVKKYAKKAGLDDPNSKKPEDRFSPHNARHWFTTHLIQAGMPREYIKELRGDARHEAIDIYNHIDPKLLKESYLAHIPRLLD
jgi:integrase/recombinase XerD